MENLQWKLNNGENSDLQVHLMMQKESSSCDWNILRFDEVNDESAEERKNGSVAAKTSLIFAISHSPENYRQLTQTEPEKHEKCFAW